MAFKKRTWVNVPDPSNPPSVPEGQDALARFDADNMNRIEEGLDSHIKDTSNPHDVTHEQVGCLKIYRSFLKLNEEIGTSFDSDTPIETIIAAMPNNTGLKADVNTIDIAQSGTTIYPAEYGILSIYKIREKRVEVEYVSNTPVGTSSYNKRWIGQYVDGKFGGFKQVFTDHNPPTAAQVGAIAKTIHLNKIDVLTIAAEGWYYCLGATNVPTPSATYGYACIRVADVKNRVVYWRPAGSTIEYVNVLSNDTWLGWTEIFTNKGGTLTNNVTVAKNGDPSVYCKNTADGNETIVRQSGGLASLISRNESTKNYRTLQVYNPDKLADESNALKFSTIIGGNVVGVYNIFGEHNKPTGSYTGLYSSGNANRTIEIGGVGALLLVYSSQYMAFVGQYGIILSKFGGQGTPSVLTTARFDNGKLILNDIPLNESGATYYYQVL